MFRHRRLLYLKQYTLFELDTYYFKANLSIHETIGKQLAPLEKCVCVRTYVVNLGQKPILLDKSFQNKDKILQKNRSESWFKLKMSG